MIALQMHCKACSTRTAPIRKQHRLGITGCAATSRGKNCAWGSSEQLPHLKLSKEGLGSSISLGNASRIGLHDALEEARSFASL